MFLAVLIVLQPLASLAVTVNVNIAIDGSFVDWQPVLNDPFNVIADKMGVDDPDNPPQGDRDFTHLAATWDNTYLYFYYRRSVAGQRQVQYIAYLDVDNDGRAETTDRVVYWGFNGSSYQSGEAQSYVKYYDPVNDAQGDVMTGDGVDMPGGLGAAIGDTNMLGRSSDGIEYEVRVPWSLLGVAPGTPMQVHFSCGQNMTLPGGVTDNAGNPWSTLYRDLSITPDRTSGVAGGTQAEYTHTVTNSGNSTETVDLSALSSQGWTTDIHLASGGGAITSVVLGPGQSRDIVVHVTVPQNNSGKTDVTTVRAASSANPNVYDTVTDTTFVGELTLTPNNSGSMAAGGTIRYTHTIRNNHPSETRTFNLTALSDHAWTTVIRDAGGNVVSSVTLAPGASAQITVDVTVPPGTPVATQDVTTVHAVMQGRPGVNASARDDTTVRYELDISPNNASPAGPGTTVTYVHNVTNSWSTSRTITLSAVSSQGWPVHVYGPDGVSEVTTIAVGPNGGSTTVYVRVTVPAGAAANAVDTTTITARYSGSVFDTATDTTTCTRLATYADANFLTPDVEYRAGETVYVRGMGLKPAYNQVRFRFIDSNGTTVYTSALIGVDAQGIASTWYALPTTAAPGTWTAVLLDSNGVEITRSTFVVTYDATISGLYASDAASVGSTSSVEATLTNSGVQAITSSKVRYAVWWDTDGSGTFNSGDTYISTSGDAVVWNGTGTPYTHLTTGVDVAAGATYSDDWAVSNRKFANKGTYRLTAVWLTSSDLVIDTRTTSFYSIPALGWWLLSLLGLVGFAWMWRRMPEGALSR